MNKECLLGCENFDHDNASLLEYKNKKYFVYRCKDCSTGFATNIGFWGVLDSDSKKASQECNKRVCCCKCMNSGPGPDFDSEIINLICCQRSGSPFKGNMMGHSSCPNFQLKGR